VKITPSRNEIQLFGRIHGLKILSVVGTFRPSLLLYYSLNSIGKLRRSEVRISIAIAIAALLFLLTASLSDSKSIAQQPSKVSAVLTEQQARSELEAVFAERIVAIKNKDTAKLKSFYSPDYSVKLPNGQIINRQEVEGLSIANHDPNTQIVESTVEIEKLKVKGNEAIVDMRQSQTYKQTLRDGTIGDIVHISRLRETWVMTAGGWKLRFTDKLSLSTQQTTLNGKKVKRLDLPPAIDSQTQISNPEDEPILQGGKSLVFIYWIEGGFRGTFPIYCDEIEVAQIKRRYFFKIKLEPGRHTFRSDKGQPLSIDLEAGRIYYLAVKESFQFPKMRGTIVKDEGRVGPQGYRLPRSLDLKPIESVYIKDHSNVITGK
jgi:hypothetical protein